MRIAVLVKQVPATDKVKIDEKTGTMVRSSVESELNPLDLYAVEEAVRIKEHTDKAEITVISMGPQSASEAIKDALSMGCDRGILLSDRAFAGSDTWATAHIISAALKKFGHFDIILTGERATDGETGQVGPSVAAQLGIPVLTYVSKIISISGGCIVAERAVEDGKETIEASLPVVVSVVKEINEPRIPNLSGKLRAKNAEIPVIGAKELGLPPEETGLKGSPTRVVSVFYPSFSRKSTIISGKSAEKAAEMLFEFLKSRGIL